MYAGRSSLTLGHRKSTALGIDMSFGEDQSRIRKGNAPNHIGIIRHAALNMIKPTKPKRVSIKGMRKAAGWDNATLTTILAQIF